MMILLKKILPFIIIALIGCVTWIIFGIISNTTPKPTSIAQTAIISNDAVVAAAHSMLQKHSMSIKKDNLIVESIDDIDSQWLTAEITILSEPADSEARTMTYVFKKDGQAVRPVAFSGDGFSKSSFQEPVPDDFIQRINTR